MICTCAYYTMAVRHRKRYREQRVINKYVEKKKKLNNTAAVERSFNAHAVCVE